MLLGGVVAGLASVAASAATLKLTTWNLEWLTLRTAEDAGLPRDVVPRAAGDFARLRGYADVLDADVVAFEEVDGAGAASAVFDPARYVVHVTGDRVVQRVGLAIRRGIAFTVHPDVTALDVYGAAAPHPLRSGADVTLELAGGVRLRVLAVHLKSGCQEGALPGRGQACAALEAQIPQLAGWIAAREAEGVAFVVLGDLNRVMAGGDAMEEALREAAPLVRVTEGHASPCWGGEQFIDHILLGGAAMGWLVADSLRVLVYRETDDADRARLSDHCPVSVRLEVPAG